MINYKFSGELLTEEQSGRTVVEHEIGDAQITTVFDKQIHSITEPEQLKYLVYLNPRVKTDTTQSIIIGFVMGYEYNTILFFNDEI